MPQRSFRSDRSLSRRTLLYGAATSAGSVALVACSNGGSQTSGQGSGGGGGGGGGHGSGGKGGSSPKEKGSATEPLKPPATLHESPTLTAQVKAGKLPKLADRIPANPYVLPHHWVKPGKYGGKLNLVDSTESGGTYGTIREYMYGFSFLRWLNDGQDIGPGMAESWEANDDKSEWTFHFRKGLKWSDGQPWTTADVLFWWNDWILEPGANQSPPDELRSGKGTVAKLTAPDDHTLTIRFDAPAPLLAEQVAAYVNGGDGGNGRVWSMPKHYLKQFHPKYNSKVGKDWASIGGAFVSHYLFATNPECPTMTGWRLRKLKEGSSSVWERNPYYYEVDRDGNQLPYVDVLNFSIVQDPQVALLQIRTGKVDFAHCNFLGIGLEDYSTLTKAKKDAGISVTLWNSGSGTGSMLFLNYDVKDPKLRKVFRNPKFRQALSHAFKRSEARKSIYFNQGKQTTGTSSPTSREFQASDEGKKKYEQWRKSYVSYDPDRAKKLLDEVGLKDSDGDGWRELPDGSKFTLRIDFPADEGDADKKKDAMLQRDWKAVGINTKRNPISPTSYGDQWAAGKLMSRTAWEVSNTGGNLVQPYWIVPIESSRWAPLEGQYYAVRGSPKEKSETDVDPFKRNPPRMAPEKGGPIEKLWKYYDQGKLEPDNLKRTQMVWEIIKIHVQEGPFFQGTVANYPQVEVFKSDLHNVPLGENLALGGLTNPWGHPTPAVYDPECFSWADPDQHPV